jgi:hypothetical protein
MKRTPECSSYPTLSASHFTDRHYITGGEIKSDAADVPLLAGKRLFLIDCNRPEREIAQEAPRLWAYLQSGIPDFAKGYICQS